MSAEEELMDRRESEETVPVQTDAESGEEVVAAAEGDGKLALPARSWSRVLIGVLLVASLVAAVVFTVLAAQVSAKASDREDALSAAEQRVPVLLTYSYRTLKDDLARSEQQTVGAFKKDYSKLLDDAVSQAATEKQISTKAVLTGAGVVDASGSKVTILVFLTQTTTAPGSAPSVNTSRVEVVMQKTDGTWKVAGLTPR